MSPYFPSLNGDISREALPLMIYVPGIDGVGYAAHKQLERLAAGFQLETFMIPFEDKHDFQSLLQIFTALAISLLSVNGDCLLCRVMCKRWSIRRFLKEWFICWASHLALF